MTTYIFILLMAFFCFTDIKYLTISNWIVLPAIFYGCYFTGFWKEALIMFLLGALLFNKERLCGGDVKLMAMAGAFIGIWALPAFILSKCFVWIYRIIKNYNGMLPFTPFLFLGCLPFLFL